MNFRELGDRAYIIAEVGQNHQGSFEIACEYIERLKGTGVDAVKFQMRSNVDLFDDESLNRPYESENSFGKTYFEHRQKLEINPSDMARLAEITRSAGFDFMCTPFDVPSVHRLMDMEVDIIKVASFDVGNLHLLNEIAKSKKPVVMSTGGANLEHISKSIEQIQKHHENIAVLHCVSMYPCDHTQLELSKIADLKELFPHLTVGLSDHFNGIMTGPIAYMLGARVFEKHVTLNRAWKGTDHSFALEIEGMRKFVRDIRRTPAAIRKNPRKDLGLEPVFQKLGKSIIATTDLTPGTTLKIEHLSGKIFASHGIPVREMHRLIGKKVIAAVKSGQKISWAEVDKSRE